MSGPVYTVLLEVRLEPRRGAPEWEAVANELAGRVKLLRLARARIVAVELDEAEEEELDP